MNSTQVDGLKNVHHSIPWKEVVHNVDERCPKLLVDFWIIVWYPDAKDVVDEEFVTVEVRFEGRIIKELHLM